MRVWVITTHTGHGENAGVMGVYASEDAARAALAAAPNMQLTTRYGRLAGEPVDEDVHPHEWALVQPFEVHG